MVLDQDKAWISDIIYFVIISTYLTHKWAIFVREVPSRYRWLLVSVEVINVSLSCLKFVLWFRPTSLLIQLLHSDFNV